MTYVYKCLSCGHRFDVIKSVKDINVAETCPVCGEFAERKFFPDRIHLSKTAVTHAEYNPGLGTVVKNARHKSDLLKEKGMVEVGNDYGSGDRMQESFEKARSEKLAKEYLED